MSKPDAVEIAEDLRQRYVIAKSVGNGFVVELIERTSRAEAALQEAEHKLAASKE